MIDVISYQYHLCLTRDYWFSWQVTLPFHLEISISYSSSGCPWHCNGHGNNSRILFLYFKWHQLNFKYNLTHWRQTVWHKGQRSLPASQTKRPRKTTNSAQCTSMLGIFFTLGITRGIFHWGWRHLLTEVPLPCLAFFWVSNFSNLTFNK